MPRDSTSSTGSAGRVRFARSPHRATTSRSLGPGRAAAVSSTSATRSSYRVRRALVIGALVTTIASGGSAAAAQGAEPAPYSAHAMVYTCCTPAALKDRMFAEAKAMRSSYIRLAIEIGPIFEAGGAWRPQPWWRGLDEVLQLSKRYHLPVVGVLYVTPTLLSTCPRAAEPGKCPPTDVNRYAELVGTIAAHARGVIRHWEVLNEPDGSWAFHGTPAQYAWMLRRTSDRVKSVAPEDRILIGGVMSPGSRGWLAQVFDTPGADARHRFDIANFHLRGTVDSLAWGVRSFRDLFAGYGFHGPLWVTEHGYPGDSRYQRDPGYHGGEAAQAHYLRQSLPTLVRAGAAQVFITLRDSTPAEFGDSEFASEGVLHIGDGPSYSARRKRSFELTRWLAGLWPRVPATRRELDAWRRQLGVARAQARRYRNLAKRERRLVRRYLRRGRRRLAALHRRRFRRYTILARRSTAAVRRLRVAIASYSDGPS